MATRNEVCSIEKWGKIADAIKREVPKLTTVEVGRLIAHVSNVMAMDVGIRVVKVSIHGEPCSFKLSLAMGQLDVLLD